MPRRVLLCLLVATAALGPLAARADECDDLIAQVAAATGSKKVGKRVGPSTSIRTAGGIGLDLTCRGPDPIVQASSSEPSPSAIYFRDLSVASGLAIGVPVETVQAALARAYDSALRERRKSFIQQGGWSASCYADPGSSSLRTLCSVGRIPRG